MQWKCKNGTVIEHTEMTEAHLVNSIKYTANRGDYRGHELLLAEHKRRWMVEERDCIWCCPGKMTRHQDHDEESWLTPWRWYCSSCGARSGEVEGWKKPL